MQSEDWPIEGQGEDPHKDRWLAALAVMIGLAGPEAEEQARPKQPS